MSGAPLNQMLQCSASPSSFAPLDPLDLEVLEILIAEMLVMSLKKKGMANHCPECTLRQRDFRSRMLEPIV